MFFDSLSGRWQGLPVAALVLGLSLPAVAKPQVGEPAPTFSLRDREGALVSLSDLAYPGRVRPRRPKQVVLMDFFRTDCAPCKKALPKLVKLHNKLKGKAVKILLMALLEDQDGEKKLDAFLKKHPLPFAVLVDSYNVAAKKYVTNKGKVKIPAMFIVDKNRVVQNVLQSLDAKALPALQKQMEKLAK